MPSVFDIERLFVRAFGTGRGFNGDEFRRPEVQKGGSFELPQQRAANQDSEFVNIRRLLGAKDASGRDIFLPIKIGELILPNAPTIRVSGSKEIVETRIVGSSRRGKVKEFIGENDPSILIRGIILNNQSSKVYPEDDVKALRDLIAINESLPVVCAITSLFNINRLVIVRYDFPELLGVQHAQAYELRCVADEDFILEID